MTIELRSRIRRIALGAAFALASANPAAGAMLAVGEAFPAWTLSDQDGKPYSSKDLAGKTYLMWFYPKAMTPGCTAEGQGLRDQFAAFQAKGVEIVGVSFDEPAANAAFCSAEKFQFKLLSDRDRSLAMAVGAAESPQQATARRISYLVGPDGKVLKAYETVTPATHASQVLVDVSKN